jgi:hypothetical protein
MTACFYQDRARMVGVDVHASFLMAVCTDMFTIWPRTFWKETSTVTADGYEMVQDGYDLYLIVHVPPPHPKAVAEALLAAATSSSKPFLVRGSVTGEGAPLACCVSDCIGVNTNCWDAGIKSFPSGLVACPSSVVTTPTPADFVTAVVGLALGNAVSIGLGKVMQLKGLADVPTVVIKHLVRRSNDLVKLAEKLLGPVLGPILLGPLAAPAKAQDVASKVKKAVRDAMD